MSQSTAAPHTPDLESLSAWLDGELPGNERRALAAHLSNCPACRTCLAELQALTADLQALPQESLGIDLATGIADRLAARATTTHISANTTPEALSAHPARGRFTARLRNLFLTRPDAGGWPLGISAAASLAFGVALGSALPADGGGAPAPRANAVTALSVFAALPPGSLCIGPEACYLKENTK